MKLPQYFYYATNITSDNEETLPPLGILYIISNSKNFIDFIDNRVQRYDTDLLINKLSKYDIVGFGGTIFEIKEARKISMALMKKGIITIYGGPNATANWNLYIDCFNIIVRGEAEDIFDKLLQNSDNLEKLQDFGFIKTGKTYVNSKVYRINNIDKLKFPDRKTINISDYKRKESSYMPDCYPVDTVVSSRGCPFDCYFCSSKFIWERKYSFRSIDNIIHEIKLLKKDYGTKGIYFREDNFTVKKNRVLEFCDKVIDLDIMWLCESRVDTLDETLIEKMAKSGCEGIWFGIESTNDSVLKRIGKGITLEQVKKTINLCNKYGIRAGGGFMLGFPFDTKESIRKNYNESKTLNLALTFYNRVWAIPISQMYFEILNRNLDYYSFENIILPSTEHLSADEVNKLYYQLVSKKDIIDKRIQRIFGKQLTNSIKEKLPVLLKIYRSLFNRI